MITAPTEDPRVHRILRPTRWIRYQRAEEVLGQLEALLAAPKSHRPSNLLIVGETNNGKSMIVRRFAAKHPRELRPTEDASQVPVLIVQAPHIPDEGAFYNEILSSLNALFRQSWSRDRRQYQAYLLMEELGVRLLVIDDIHNILAGPTAKQRAFQNLLRHMGNKLMIPIVATGTREAFRAIQSDEQLANRFFPAKLPKWKIEDPQYFGLLNAFEQDFQLQKPSALSDTTMALKILSMSKGTIGEISQLLTRAAAHAITTGTEQITTKILESCGYVPPSDRDYHL